MTNYSVLKVGEMFVVAADDNAVIGFENAASAVQFAQTIVNEDSTSAVTIEPSISENDLHPSASRP